MNAVLALENGTVYRGTAAGAHGIARGEVVFNTSMTGYQEVLTDPSYAGQIVTMTTPQIGNYGVAPDDVESEVPKVAGFIMREESPIASNWRASGTLRDYLVTHNVVAIADIDTRELTRLLRSSGVMRGVIATGDVETAELVRQARAIPNMEGTDLVRDVTCEAPFLWPAGIAKNLAEVRADLALAPQSHSKRPLRVGAYDFGIKWNILRRLVTYGCEVNVFPASTPAKDVLAAGVDGIFLSNGPGDPAAVELRHREHARPDAGRQADLRHLSRSSDSRAGARRKDLQAEVRAPRREPSGEIPGDGKDRDHLAESRLRRRSRIAAERCEGDAPQSVRRNG